MSFRDESRGKPDWVGVHASERLSFARFGEASWGKPRRKPESRNSTFRDCRGASANVVMVGMCTRLAIERARTVTPHLQLARPSSIPTTSGSVGGSGRNPPGRPGSHSEAQG